MNDTNVKKSKCIRCGGWYDSDVGFNSNVVRDIKQRRPRCKGCEGEKRQKGRTDDPFLQKAQTTIRHHADRYGMKTREFMQRYGWDVERVAHLMRHAYENTCTYCRKPYAKMTNGPSEVTADIRDPKQPPYLDTNVVPCCRSCNFAKRDSSPEQWARQLQFWRQWEVQQERNKCIDWHQVSIFE